MVAELDLRAADERRIDRERRADLLPARALETADELLALELAQLHRGRHTRLRDPLPRVDELAVCRGDRRDERDAVALEQEPQERTDRDRLVVRRGRERGGAPTERDPRVAERFDGRAIERLGDPVERDPVRVHGLLRRGEVEHGLGVAPRRGAAYGHRSGLLAGELRPGLVEGSFDELPMPLGRDLAPEHAARGEDDHGRELAAELRERLIVQLLRVGPTALADAVSLGLRLRAQIGGRRLRGFCRAVRDLLRLSPRPSARPAPRIMFGRMTAAASGLRPIASDDFGGRMPTPMPGPRTPKPTAIPAASHARFIEGVPFCGIWSCGLRLRMRDLART